MVSSTALCKPNVCHRVSSLWFEDGGLVIQAEDRLFKVYRDLLAARSSVFGDMLSLPQAPTGGDLYEGCHFVQLPDNAKDVESFLLALFDSSFFRIDLSDPKRMPDYHQVSGVLRLSHKYNVPYLREMALRRFSSTIPSNLQEWDSRDHPPTLDVELSSFIPLCHEVGATWLLPVSFYNLSLLPIEEIHSTFSAWSKAHSSLLLDYLRGQRLMQRWPYAFLAALGKLSGMSYSLEDCAFLFEHTSSALIHFLEEEKDSPTQMSCLREFYPEVWEDNVLGCTGCTYCAKQVKGTVTRVRGEFWDALPSFFGLPPWSELEIVKNEALSI